MRVAVSSDNKTITQSQIVPTPKDFEEGIQTLNQIAQELKGGEKIEGVAGGVAGPLDQDKTMLVKSPNISGWIQKPLKQALEKVFNVPVYLENDANLEGLGEANFGAGSDKEIVAFVTIGTGVGGVRIVKKTIDQNALGFEPGHQIIVIDGHDCNCGGKGHLEAYIGGSYLEKIYGKKAEDLADPTVWDQVAKYLAVGLQNTIVHWSPDIVILGGSVMKSLPLDLVKEHLQNTLTIFPRAPEIVLAKLGDSAGLYGALKLLNHNI